MTHGVANLHDWAAKIGPWLAAALLAGLLFTFQGARACYWSDQPTWACPSLATEPWSHGRPQAKNETLHYAQASGSPRRAFARDGAEAHGCGDLALGIPREAAGG